jgi:hypothetical protein
MVERRVLQVQGQEFTVTGRHGEPGVYDFEWTSGPHEPKYGFTRARSDRAAIADEEMRSAIVAFLSQINPETGYLD